MSSQKERLSSSFSIAWPPYLMTMTEPGGVFFFTFLIKESYSASVVGAARNTVDTLEAYLDGAMNAHEAPKKFSTNAQKIDLTNIKLQSWW